MLIKYNPLVPRDAFDNMISSFFNDNHDKRYSADFPKYQQQVTDTELTLQFALAGYPAECLSVEATSQGIEIRAEKQEEGEGLFAQRAFTKKFSDSYGAWDFTKAGVNYSDGMLTVKIPKKESLKPKQLEIKQTNLLTA